MALLPFLSARGASTFSNLFAAEEDGAGEFAEHVAEGRAEASEVHEPAGVGGIVHARETISVDRNFAREMLTPCRSIAPLFI